MVGMFATSIAGHDKGQMYIIIKEEGDFAYLADGRTRALENPKKKRKKHLAGSEGRHRRSSGKKTEKRTDYL